MSESRARRRLSRRAPILFRGRARQIDTTGARRHSQYAQRMKSFCAKVTLGAEALGKRLY